MSGKHLCASQAPTCKQIQEHRSKDGRYRHKVRVDHAMLFYKTDGIVEWQMLERNEIGSHTDSNIVDLEFNGGIEFGQNGQAWGDDKDLQLRVRWEASDYQHVWLHQYQRRMLKNSPYQHLTVMFNARSPPTATIVRARMDPNLWPESGRANKKSKCDNKELSVPASGVEASTKLEFHDVSKIPLHRLANHFADDKFTKILLVFPKRLSVRPKPPAALWSWETVIHLSLNKGSYLVRGKRPAEEERNAKSLEDQSCAINVEEGHALRKADVGFWLCSTKSELTHPVAPILPDLALARKDFIDSQAVGEATNP